MTLGGIDNVKPSPTLTKPYLNSPLKEYREISLRPRGSSDFLKEHFQLQLCNVFLAPQPLGPYHSYANRGILFVVVEIKII